MKQLDNIKTFVADVVVEIKKTTWPAREELMQSTIVVIASLFMLGFFVAFSDKVIAVIIKTLTL